MWPNDAMEWYFAILSLRINSEIDRTSLAPAEPPITPRLLFTALTAWELKRVLRSVCIGSLSLGRSDRPGT